MNRYSVVILITLIASLAHAGSLPPLINFQSVLLDEGGNLLPSGPTTIQFQILDENRAPIYSESQSVEVVKGATAALIGNGADTKGAPTGGIPEDIFATGAPRYLQVQVGSHAPEDPMTIVPVPYSQWSATCATVSDGGVKPTSIAKAAVGFEALAPDVVSKLADALSKSQGVVTAQTLGASGGATQVGVTSKFINSGSATVQGVLQDIDLSVKKGQETDTFLTGKLNQEVTDRGNAISDVQGKLAQETATRAATDSAFSQTLSDINNIPGTLSLSKVQTSSPPPSDLNMGGHKITNLGTPSSAQDAATKTYVDSTAAAIVAQFPAPAINPPPPPLYLWGYWVGAIKTNSGFGAVTIYSNNLAPTGAVPSGSLMSATGTAYQFGFTAAVPNATYLVTASDEVEGLGTVQTARYLRTSAGVVTTDTRTVNNFALSRQGQDWELYQVYVYGSVPIN